MKKYAVLVLTLFVNFESHATSVLERSLVECTLSTDRVYEELALKYVETQDGDDYIYNDYVLDYLYGELYGESSDFFGRHEQVRSRIFTSANADAEGVIALDQRDYQMIVIFDHSELVINLLFEGLNQNGFATYTMTFEGEGPAYEIVVESVEEILANSEHYSRYDNPLCVSHFDLNEFVSQ